MHGATIKKYDNRLLKIVTQEDFTFPHYTWRYLHVTVRD